MSENLIPSTSSAVSLDEKKCEKKMLMNAATQHGNESNADEENIVLLAVTRSPIRETDDEVVWHEEFIYPDDDVSTNNIYYAFNYY